LWSCTAGVDRRLQDFDRFGVVRRVHEREGRAGVAVTAHPPRVRSLVALVGTLVVLHRRRRPHVPVRDERLDGELLADQSLLEDDAVVAGLAEIRLGLVFRHLIAGDADALAAGEAHGFDGQVAVGGVDVVAGGVHVGERLEVGTARNVVVPHEPSLVGLVRLDAGRLGAGTEGVDAGVVEGVGDARRER
jgi:hypothetical protein